MASTYNTETPFSKTDKSDSINQRHVSRTLLRSVGKNALANSRQHPSSLSALSLKGGMTMDLKRSGTLLPKVTSTATISLDELEQMRQHAYAVDTRIAENEEKRRHKQELREISKTRMDTWTNTIQGYMHQLKEKNLKKLEQDEMDRRHKDLLEHELNREKREMAL